MNIYHIISDHVISYYSPCSWGSRPGRRRRHQAEVAHPGLRAELAFTSEIGTPDPN